jgi:hypothetical protein
MTIEDKAKLKELKLLLLNEKISKLRIEYFDYDRIAHNNSVLYDNIDDEIRDLNKRKTVLISEMEYANELLIEFNNKRDDVLAKINKKISKRDAIKGECPA